jgi:plastocyanin
MNYFGTVALSLCCLANAAGGTLTGIVKFEGEKPTPRPLTEIKANSFCSAACAGKLPDSDKFVFGKNGDTDTVANVLVYVSKGLEGKKFDAPKAPVVIDQVNCLYTPHVSAAMVGQTVEILNSDATLHNVMTRPKKNKAFNDGMPSKGSKLTKVFDKPELGVDLRCFMHPWMLGYVHVLEHPFYAVTGPDGSFRIENLPPGEYEVSLYHEFSRFKAEPANASIRVGADESKKLEFTYHLSTN